MKDKTSRQNPTAKASKSDLIEMQTEYALLKAMLKSKTLVAMLLIGLSLFAGLIYFLISMAS
ncbi:hypothetical protein [Litorilituus sediminis]|uniref:Uncharacterized protein n=1 Tax=Litorilituus sediminis TaxID=718192 RepID=A0A4P6P7J9_9GAMM|nr:hypothetical protein [Litorilituus sediminis]QBG37028.1 hypothetical protein EMK97_15505 [Litorilituus sediminis]